MCWARAMMGANSATVWAGEGDWPVLAKAVSRASKSRRAAGLQA